MTASTLIGGETGDPCGLDLGELEPGPVLQIAYRNRLLRALRKQLRAGKISRNQYQRIAWASFNREFISGFIVEVEAAAKAAGDFIDDVRKWFGILTQWLIDNWELVLKIALTLLMLL